MDHLTVRGARQHNLKNISCEIPRDKLVVITGPLRFRASPPSPSIPSTPKDNARYVESLSAYARQFLEQLAKPDVDSIEGLSPAIAIEQRALARSPRSTVGTVTEISDYLRLLFASRRHPSLPHLRKAHRSPGPSSRSLTSSSPGRAATSSPSWLPSAGLAAASSSSSSNGSAETGFVRVRVDGQALGSRR